MAKDPGGRPPFQPTDPQRQMVQVLVANGIAHAVIAQNIGCDVKTLKRHFKPQLDNGHGQVEAALGAAIVKAGLGGNVHAAKYWLATHGGPQWKITERRELGGIEGGPPILISGESKVIVYLPDNGRGDGNKDGDKD